MDFLKGYKSIIFFGLALVVAVANILGFAGFQMTSDQLDWFGVLVPLFGVVLRTLTTSPIFKG